MRVVLLLPRWTDSYGIFGHFARKQSGRPPLGLAYLAAVTERAGHTVSIIDGEHEGMDARQLAMSAVSWKPDIVGITAATPFFHVAKQVATEIKQRDESVPIAIGGPHITTLKEQAFDPVFDFGFVGEADNSWPQFLECFYRRGYRGEGLVKGLLYRDHDRRIVFTGGSELTDVSRLPLPARHLLGDYTIGTPQGKKKLATLMFSRGCPFQCVYCANLFGRTVRKRSSEQVAAEMIRVRNAYGIDHFLFEDDNLTIDKAWTLRLCDLLSKGPQVTFEGCTRADLIDEELISRMASVGLVRLMFGLETVSSDIRQIIKKGVSLQEQEKANRLCVEHRVEVLNFVMLGLPGETRETVNRTLSYVKQAKDIGEVTFSIATPYPGTEFLQMAKEKKHGLSLCSEDWELFRRYGSAVVGVNDLGPQDLVRLQNDGLVNIYLAFWRWKPMFRKMGTLGAILMLLRLVMYLVKRKN